MDWNKLDKIVVKEYIRKPDETNTFKIPADSYKIHGINITKANKYGVLFDDIVKKYLKKDILLADFIIAHDAFFDVMILLNELYRYNKNNLIDKINNLIVNNKIICTGVIGKKFMEYKNCLPKLSALYDYYFGVLPKKTNQAGDDVLTLVKILPKMRKGRNKESIIDYYNNKLEKMPDKIPIKENWMCEYIL